MGRRCKSKIKDPCPIAPSVGCKTYLEAAKTLPACPEYQAVRELLSFCVKARAIRDELRVMAEMRTERNELKVKRLLEPVHDNPVIENIRRALRLLDLAEMRLWSALDIMNAVGFVGSKIKK